MTGGGKQTDFYGGVITNSEAETRRLGVVLGRHVRPSTPLTLLGDLGSGKTVLVQGLAEGLAVPDAFYVTSPTFTLINEYPGRYRLYHVDLYRIGDLSELEGIGFYDLFNGTAVVAIEWADRLTENFFTQHLDVRFETVERDIRHIQLTAYGSDAGALIRTIRQQAGLQWD